VPDLIPTDWLQDPITLQEADGQYRGVEWESIKRQMQPGDQLVRFVSSFESWEHHAGRAGIALVREGKVVAAIVTLMN
jgi:hypothetical protein